MTGNRKVWILDDGELFEIRGLVTSARRALLDQDKGPEAGTHLIVFEESSLELRNVLEGSGCDFVMSLPLNRHAFNLPLNYALYEGPEKRFSRRVLLSAPVELKRGLQCGRRDAHLALPARVWRRHRPGAPNRTRARAEASRGPHGGRRADPERASALLATGGARRLRDLDGVPHGRRSGPARPDRRPRPARHRRRACASAPIPTSRSAM